VRGSLIPVLHSRGDPLRFCLCLGLCLLPLLVPAPPACTCACASACSPCLYRCLGLYHPCERAPFKGFFALAIGHNYIAYARTRMQLSTSKQGGREGKAL